MVAGRASAQQRSVRDLMRSGAGAGVSTLLLQQRHVSVDCSTKPTSHLHFSRILSKHLYLPDQPRSLHSVTTITHNKVGAKTLMKETFSYGCYTKAILELYRTV